MQLVECCGSEGQLWWTNPGWVKTWNIILCPLTRLPFSRNSWHIYESPSFFPHPFCFLEKCGLKGHCSEIFYWKWVTPHTKLQHVPVLLKQKGLCTLKIMLTSSSFAMQNISQPFLLLLPFLPVFPIILVDASIHETFKKGIFLRPFGIATLDTPDIPTEI